MIIKDTKLKLHQIVDFWIVIIKTWKQEDDSTNENFTKLSKTCYESSQIVSIGIDNWN